jgi:hypothetical protein
MLMPLLILWGVVEQLLRRGPRRRSNPFAEKERFPHAMVTPRG